MNSLLATYHPGVRPLLNSSDAVHVNVTWEVAVVRGVIEKESKTLMTVVIGCTWKDEFLTWNPRRHGNISRLVFGGSQIWSPRPLVLNKLGQFLSKGFTEDLMEVTSDGLVTAKHTGDIELAANIDTQEFPFDSQVCTALIQFNKYTPSEVYMEDVRLSLRLYTQSPVWEISSADTINYFYPQTQIASFKFILKRKPLYYVFTMFGPSLILSILLLVAFFLPNDNGEKIMCGTTIFLSYVVFLTYLSDMLPEDSNNVPKIGMYYILLMISSAVMVVNSIAVNFFREKDGGLCFAKSAKRLNAQLILPRIINVLCFVISFICTLSAFLVIFNRGVGEPSSIDPQPTSQSMNFPGIRIGNRKKTTRVYFERTKEETPGLGGLEKSCWWPNPQMVEQA
ncbi:neuronal acetylcholine receptor subunit beta-3-like [Saccostrea echinata]|uniref:neuronal acetylcholine receptor subunit beta-3-like n=1 Tax=Saccostrea echinata TaxID=191078 RepID=UPI002A7F97F1|nr:neuronal acetylcholine receptor subunit beta-3-like [Saccostrea echinata]